MQSLICDALYNCVCHPTCTYQADANPGGGVEGAVVIKTDIEDASANDNSKAEDSPARKTPDTPGSDTADTSTLSTGYGEGGESDSVKLKRKALAILGIDEDEEERIKVSDLCKFKSHQMPVVQLYLHVILCTQINPAKRGSLTGSAAEGDISQINVSKCTCVYICTKVAQYMYATWWEWFQCLRYKV